MYWGDPKIILFAIFSFLTAKLVNFFLIPKSEARDSRLLIFKDEK